MIHPGLLRPAALLFNRPIEALMPKLSRSPIPYDHNDDHYAALIERQWNNDRDKYIHKKSHFCLQD